MRGILPRVSLRHLLRHPGQAALSILGVALGVAVTVSVGLANDSAERAFDLSTEAVTGRTTHQAVGGPDGIAEEAFGRLVLEAPEVPAAPVVEGYVVLPGEGEAAGRRAFRLLGIDPLAEGPFRPYLTAGTAGPRGEAGSFDLGVFLTRPGAALLSEATATELSVAPGDRLQLAAGSGADGSLELVGLLAPEDELSRRALADLVVVDVSTAQELLGDIGRLSRIDLVLPDDPAVVERARRLLGPEVEILPAAARSSGIQQMTHAFRVNLTALSLLALTCGLFLIYNTMTFSVVQRRPLIGTLRALGVTRREVFALVLGEAAAVAVLGSALGLVGGVALGRGLVGLVTRTINDLYFVVSVRELAVAPLPLVIGGVLGIVATLGAALAPALEATAAPPRQALVRSTLEARAHRALPRAIALGLSLLAGGGALLALPGRGGVLAVSFAGLFGVLLGFALLTPAATVVLMRALVRPMGRLFGVLGKMAARGVDAALSRTGVAIAALMIAVSVTVGVGTMIESFRGTVERWLEGTLSADFYLSPAAGNRAAGGATVTPEVASRLAEIPGVVRVNTVRRVELESLEESAGGEVEVRRTQLVVFDLDRAGFAGFDLTQGDAEAAWAAFEDRGAVIVSEPYAYRYDVEVGDSLPLRTPAGERRFPVAAVYTDYASDRGVVLISRATYGRHWSDRQLSGLSVVLAPGAGADEVAGRLRARLGELGSEGTLLTLQSSRALREASLEIFDRTFVITDVLRLLAALVAFIGVLSALMALQLERGKELGVLRANGLTPRQLFRLVTAQTGLMGLAAGLFALPVGLTLAAVMIFVINRRSFGWSLDMALAPAILGEAVILALAAALAAGLYPALRMARTSPAAALREE